MESVNHFNVKRKAHGISRRDSEQSWNPFRHFAWDDRRPSRRETWNGDLESQREVQADDNNNNNDGEKPAPLGHVQSEPGLISGMLPRDFSTADTMGGSSFAKETNAPVTRTRSGSQQNSGETMAESEQSSAPAAAAKEPETDSLRKRKAGVTANSTNNTLDKEKDDKKAKRKGSGLIRHPRPKHPYTVANQLQRTFFNSWINVLLVAAPIGIAMNFIPSTKGVPVFVVNFIAIIPLAAMLSFATEEIALRTGETLGGLLNATFGYVLLLRYNGTATPAAVLPPTGLWVRYGSSR
jgi:hypothetical protein